MKKLLPLLFLAAAAGCAGLQVDAQPVLDCIEACANQEIMVVTAAGDTLWINLNDYADIHLKDGRVTLKDYKVSELELQ